jgi:predicted regulator of Ras-like GTPase activity (Roadblock/LC7/MglB family)
MVYQAMLQKLCSRVPGSHGALLLDEGGEVVVETSPRREGLRLIGAYQGIALAAARKTAERYEVGPVEQLVCRYAGGSVIVVPLKDRYFLVLAVGAETNVPRALFQSHRAQEELNKEI